LQYPLPQLAKAMATEVTAAPRRKMKRKVAQGAATDSAAALSSKRQRANSSETAPVVEPALAAVAGVLREALPSSEAVVKAPLSAGKAAKKLKKKLREQMKKQKLREARADKPEVVRSEGLDIRAKRDKILKRGKEGKEQAVSKRMKKRANWLAKHPKPLPKEAPTGAGKGKGKGDDEDDKEIGVHGYGAPVGGIVRTITSERSSRYVDSEEEYAEEEYKGRRATKSAGKGGGTGIEGRRKPKKGAGKGAPSHLSKKDRQQKKKDKASKYDDGHFDKSDKKKGSGKGGGASKGRKKGKGR